MSDLQRLGNGSSLRLIFEASFDAGLTRLPFPIRTLTIATSQPVTGFETWEGFTLQTLPLNEPINGAHGLKLTVTGSAAHIVNVNSVYPPFGDRALQTAANCELRLEFGGVINELWLSHVGAETSKNVFTFYDARNSEIEHLSLTSASTIVSQTITLTRACTYCIAAITGDANGILIDNLIWKS